jgi:hypothetical protein
MQWRAAPFVIACAGLLGAAPLAQPAAAHRGWARPAIAITSPRDGQLSLAGPVPLSLWLPFGASAQSLSVAVDGAPVDPTSLTIQGPRVFGTLAGLLAGPHTLDVTVDARRGSVSRSIGFELVALENPDECEILNAVACALPFPSSRFLERAHTRTGYRVVYGPNTLPVYNRLESLGYVTETKPVDPTPFLQNDGFSPTVQALMHFPGGIDPELSDAPRLHPETRSFDARGLDPSSPTVLIDFQTGRRVNHWIENDARPRRANPRIVTFLRPTESLLPGHRYIVAVRKLRHADGSAVEAEPVFAAIRDRRPSDIPAVREARWRLEPVLRRLERFGVPRDELILAFDFVVSSDESLTHEMLSMRDQAFAWLEAEQAQGIQTFQVSQVLPRNESCDPAGGPIWRELRGTFQVPLFLTRDPFLENRELSFLQRDAKGEPVYQTTTAAPFGLAIPCSAEAAPLPSLVIGHGLFGSGPSTISSLVTSPELGGFDFVSAATNWSGLSSPDREGPIDGSFIFKVIANVDEFSALPDRLRQGQLNTLVLARMLKRGLFNSDPAVQIGGHGPIDPERPTYYWGASLGGIMGTMFAALTPDVEALNVDVPAINFSLLLQRATPFIDFQILVNFINSDFLEQAIGFGLNHELWVRGEPAGYATHIAARRPRGRLPGVGPKRMLVTAALLDQQVSNLGSALLARTLRLPMLEGSVMRGVPGIPDSTGPQTSAFVVYDTGSFDVTNPAHLPFIPPLVNQPAQPNRCDPHGLRGFIPASVDQLAGFLRPGGLIENFCADGVCDASEPNEIPFGLAAPCDPLQ